MAFRGPFFAALPPPTQFGGSVVPTPSSTIAISNAVLLPQIVTGAGWTSNITIANLSRTPQSVRVDFFDSGEGPVRLPLAVNIPNTIIQPGGVVTVSTGSVPFHCTNC
jgi:hypothetical protein